MTNSVFKCHNNNFIQTRCLSCNSQFDESAFTIGNLHPCNRFTVLPEIHEKHLFQINFCKNCALIQQIDPMPIDLVAPRVPFISYNEPSWHIPNVVKNLNKKALFKSNKILGIGPFDKVLVDSFTEFGLQGSFAKLSNSNKDKTFPYLETWQNEILYKQLKIDDGPYDIVSCRYMLEHSHNPLLSLKNMSQFMTEDGILVIEVPDSSKFIKGLDYSFLWEEHICYFTQKSLLNLCKNAGFNVIQFERYENIYEDSLVVFLKPFGNSDIYSGIEESDFNNFKIYKDSFKKLSASIRNKLKCLSKNGKEELAVYGIGHQSIMFSQLFDLNWSNHVIDDNSNKIGFFTSGFSKQIVDSGILSKNLNIKHCLLSLSPLTARKVINDNLLNADLRFYSIFSQSDISFYKVL